MNKGFYAFLFILSLFSIGCIWSIYKESFSPPYVPEKVPSEQGSIQNVRVHKPLPHHLAFIPTKLDIPAANIHALVEPVSVLKNGNMGVPRAFDKVGILSPWTKPGENGNAVIAGHFDHYTGPAVFYNLRKLKQGDKIFVSDGKGKKLTFVVKKVESYKTPEAPLEQIFGKSSTPHLNLITCGGKFNKKTQEHARRVVVFSDIAS
jgi:LPXTG-site transpeptidase (sortase) family protein